MGTDPATGLPVFVKTAPSGPGLCTTNFCN